MADCGFRVDVVENGLVLEYEDPEARKRNREDDGPWIDPWKKRVYDGPEALLADIGRLLPVLIEHAGKPESREDSFESALSEAFQE